MKALSYLGASSIEKLGPLASLVLGWWRLATEGGDIVHE